MFGRVEAIAVPGESAGRIRITVYLETGQTIRSIRDEQVPSLRPVLDSNDLAWHADQYAQETIGTDLALEGWEVIGGGDIPRVIDGAVARSAAYAVRRLSIPEGS